MTLVPRSIFLVRIALIPLGVPLVDVGQSGMTRAPRYSTGTLHIVGLH